MGGEKRGKMTVSLHKHLTRTQSKDLSGRINPSDMITCFYYVFLIKTAGFIFMKYKLCCSFVICDLYEHYTRAIFDI